ncbi:MAG: hypothetical protein OHK0046_05830 [Anaerolineae bacterium]
MSKEGLWGTTQLSMFVLLGLLAVVVVFAVSLITELPAPLQTSASPFPVEVAASALVTTPEFNLTDRNAADYHRLGAEYLAMAAYEQATVHYSYALALDPENRTYYVDRGRAYAAWGLLALAANDYEDALALGADPALIAQYFQELGEYERQRGHYPEALDYLDYAIQLNPVDARLVYMRGLIYQTAGNWIGAMQSYEQVIAMNRELGYTILMNWGSAAQTTRAHQQAVEHYSRAIQLFPDRFEPYLYRSTSLYTLGRAQDAYNDLLSAFNLEPGNSEVYEYLAWYYNNEGQTELAQSYYQQAVALGQ